MIVRLRLIYCLAHGIRLCLLAMALIMVDCLEIRNNLGGVCLLAMALIAMHIGCGTWRNKKNSWDYI